MRWQDHDLIGAVKACDLLAMSSAFNAGADANAGDVNDRTPLYHAVGATPEVIRALLDRKADPQAGDARGYTPLMHAVAELDFVAADMMLAAGADINHQVEHGSLTALHSAVMADIRKGAQSSRVEYVLKKNPDLGLGYHWDGRAGLTPYQLACCLTGGDNRIARMLASAQALRLQNEKLTAEALARALEDAALKSVQQGIGALHRHGRKAPSLKRRGP